MTEFQHFSMFFWKKHRKSLGHRKLFVLFHFSEFGYVTKIFYVPNFFYVFRWTRLSSFLQISKKRNDLRHHWMLCYIMMIRYHHWQKCVEVISEGVCSLSCHFVSKSVSCIFKISLYGYLMQKYSKKPFGVLAANKVVTKKTPSWNDSIWLQI